MTKKKPPTTQREWLEVEIARLDVEGATLEDQSRAAQFRYELTLLAD